MLSLLLHGALLIVPPSGHPAPPRTPPITVDWAATTPRPIREAQRATSAGVARRLPATATATATATNAATPAGSPSPQAISTHDLLEDARQTARNEGLRIERQGKTDGPRQNAPENQLARALTRPQAQEKLLASGTYRITSSAGTTYCLNEAPDFNRGGLSEALRVASTCP